MNKRSVLQAALDQVSSDVAFVRSLVTFRENETNLTQKDVAEKLGWKLEKVQRIENMEHDPTLGELRRYALAVGARVNHKIEKVS